MTSHRGSAAPDPAPPAQDAARPGTTVYLDAASLTIPRATGGRPSRLQPSAEPAILHLRDAGYDVVLTGAPGPVGSVIAALRDDAPPARTALPPDGTGWLVTVDPAACVEARGIPGIRTILVGPAVPGQNLAHRRSDVEARDLLDAVLVILAAEAMPDPRQRQAD